MADINGRPFLEILLTRLAKSGFQKAVLAVGHMHEVIIEHFGESFKDIELAYSIEKELLGTGGALKACEPYLEHPQQFIMNGDTICDIDYSQMMNLWKNFQLPVIACTRVPNTSRYGRIHIENGTIRRISEKGEAGEGLISSGCYLMSRKWFCGSELPNKFSLEAELLTKLVSQKKLICFETSKLFIDIGIPSDLQVAQYLLNDDR